jgi:hypothetical protein
MPVFDERVVLQVKFNFATTASLVSSRKAMPILGCWRSARMDKSWRVPKSHVHRHAGTREFVRHLQGHLYSNGACVYCDHHDRFGAASRSDDDSWQCHSFGHAWCSDILPYHDFLIRARGVPHLVLAEFTNRIFQSTSALWIKKHQANPDCPVSMFS